MKNIVVWLKASQKEIFQSSYYKSVSYNQLARNIQERHNLFFAFDASSYRGGDIFEPVSEYVHGVIEPTKKQITADIIYNLGDIPNKNFKTLNAKITNTPAFKDFCSSKFDTWQYLSEFSPKTIFLNTEEDFFRALGQIETDTAVFKPNNGTHGVGVRIFQKNNPHLNDEMKMDIKKGALLQEFIDTKSGIKNICDSHHDLRLVTINEKVVLSHVRIPEPGSLIANHQQGATILEVAPEAIPKEIVSFYAKVHAKIASRFPQPMYSMDIGLGASGPRLFELNGHTAFPWTHFKSRDFFIENLVAHLENLS